MLRIVTYIFLLAIALSAAGQHTGTHIVGYVRDADTREPVPGVAVTLPGGTLGVITSEQGGFTIDTDVSASALRFTAMGYQTQDVTLKPGQTVLVVDLHAAPKELDEVLVQRSKEKYSKRNNPAVELATRLRRGMHDYDPMRKDFYSYDRYQRIAYGFNNLDEIAINNKSLRQFGYLAEYADTSCITGKRVLPVSMREQVSKQFYRRSPACHREVVVAQRDGGLDEGFDQTSVQTYLEDIFREVDIYGSDITLLSNRFVSPLSTIGPDFYKYYLTDTVNVNGTECIELSFAPRVPETFGFTGRLYVALGDTTLFIKKVRMSVPQRINLNYVEHLTIEQDYLRAPDGTRLKTRDNMEVEFRLVAGTPGMFARRETAYTSHRLTAPDDMSIFNQPEEHTVTPGADHMPDEFWADHRPTPQRTDGNSMRQMFARLRESKLFYWGEKVLMALVKGYVPTGNPSRWDFGPINTTISGNPLEGVRLRLGGMTTVNLSCHWFARTYVAYGTRDQRLKYMGQLEYSFTPKQHLDKEFPIHSLRLMHRYDVDRLGQHYLYTNADNVFLILKRQSDDKMLYLRRTELEWKREWANHFSIAVGMEHSVHEASRLLPMRQNDGTALQHFTQAGFQATLRFAPGEKFYQTRSCRIPINMDAPIVTLSHTWHPQRWMNTRREMHRTELGLQKRFWFSAFGYTDVIVKGTKIWNTVDFPDLLIPNANLSYTVQPESYALMDAMEFVCDQELSWDITYWANGALLNRVPLVKYLKLREVFTFRGMWGSLRQSNNPALNNDVLRFPDGALCQPMGSKPYMEIGVGLDNIFTILRLDYVWRLTYRDTPGVNRSGLRVALHFNF